MYYREWIIFDQWLHYTFKCQKNSGPFEILNNISEYVILVQLLDAVCNVSHTVSIASIRIFGSNLK